MAWYLLFLLVMAVVVAIFIWDYRRKAVRREAASRERFERMFNAKAAAAASAELPMQSPAAVEARAAPMAQAAASTLPVRERFLGQAQTLVYFLLKAGIPDHEVFPSVSLATVVGAPGGEQQARRLSQYQLDFVVCDKEMRIAAVVEVEAASGADAMATQRFKADCLKTAGVRLVRLNPAALPRREEIRALVCGGPFSTVH